MCKISVFTTKILITDSISDRWAHISFSLAFTHRQLNCPLSKQMTYKCLFESGGLFPPHPHMPVYLFFIHFPSSHLSKGEFSTLDGAHTSYFSAFCSLLLDCLVIVVVVSMWRVTRVEGGAHSAWASV